jgi:thioredoxin reductase (NADPH)
MTPYDLIVIGAGPAGLTAAADCARAGLRCLCLDKLAPGGVLINLTALHEVDVPEAGTDMAARLTDAAMAAGVEIGFGEVVRISGNGPWTIETADGEHHAGRGLVIATGLDKGRLGLPNEDEFEGRGLSHCASCDGPLYAGQSVVVAGADGWAPTEARELQGFVGDVTVVDPSAAKAPDDLARVEGRIVALEGADGLQSIVIESNGARRSMPAKAVFVYVGMSPAAEFLSDLLARDASGHIVVDNEGRTSAPTVFAVGDVRAGSKPLLSEAIADGRRAAKAIVATLKKS